MIGKVVGKFKIEGLAGEGGMGIVYRAFDTKLKRFSALKFLHPELTKSHESRERFIQEARVAARLSHPNITTVYDIIDYESQLIIVWEWIDGGNLGGIYFTDPPSWPQATKIIEQIADALGAAHAAGIIHRDIKPSNIMLTSRGQAKVCDFGVARITDSPITVEIKPNIVGTPNRIAPELWQGKDIDHRVDIFSLGTLAYELYTGRPPFGSDKDMAELCYRIVHEPHAPPSTFNSNLPEAVNQVIGAALAKKPEDRPHSSIAFAEQLRSAFEPTPKSKSSRTNDATTKQAQVSSQLDIPQPDGSTKTYRRILITVEAADIFTYQADVLGLKYAQALYGVDMKAVVHLEKAGMSISASLPPVGKSSLITAKEPFNVKSILFIGVNPLQWFGYQDIRLFGSLVLNSLVVAPHEVKHLAITLHGPGFGLDAVEALKAEVAGLLDAIRAGKSPPSLERVTIVEQDRRKAHILSEALDRILPRGSVFLNQKGIHQGLNKTTTIDLEKIGKGSDKKPYIFAALPTIEEMDDIYHYGIHSPINACGFLCERHEVKSFTADVLERVKKRISTASLMVADVSAPDPNVYFEIGYGWGCDKLVIFLIHADVTPDFDPAKFPHIRYRRIKDLEKSLSCELEKHGILSDQRN